MWGRFRLTFVDTPVFFFAVVIGVALTFRVGVGAIRDAAIPPEVAPTFVPTAPEPGLASASPSASASAEAIGEVGAAAKVQPLGAPAPARVAPRTRGHGRRPIRP